MAQLCNVSFVVQMQSLEEKNQPRFLANLNRPPDGQISRARTHVDPGLLKMMGG